jgi:hypothetical protein
VNQGWSQGWNACPTQILPADFDPIRSGNSANPLLRRFSDEIDTVGVGGSKPPRPDLSSKKQRWRRRDELPRWLPDFTCWRWHDLLLGVVLAPRR